LSNWIPTPTQKLDEAQDTPNSSEPGLGLGLGTTDQVEPFQDSMSVVRPAKDDPTAMHDVEELQETPMSWPSVPVLRPRAILQVDPFHISARG